MLLHAPNDEVEADQLEARRALLIRKSSLSVLTLLCFCLVSWAAAPQGVQLTFQTLDGDTQQVNPDEIWRIRATSTSDEPLFEQPSTHPWMALAWVAPVLGRAPVCPGRSPSGSSGPFPSTSETSRQLGRLESSVRRTAAAPGRVLNSLTAAPPLSRPAMIKTILSTFALLPLLVSAAPALPVTQGSQLVRPYGILKVKTADDEDSRIKSRWREDHVDADWYDGRQDDRAEAFKQYS